uniref:DN20536 n=3 Tax=Braconinae TaxID=65225 RepID=A0A455LAS5_9HYME|nr:DN20536 [Habrobracon hebetor]
MKAVLCLFFVIFASVMVTTEANPLLIFEAILHAKDIIDGIGSFARQIGLISGKAASVVDNLGRQTDLFG